MDKEIYNKGYKEYRRLFTNKPSKFDIWWYGYDVYKYLWGLAIGIALRGLI